MQTEIITNNNWPPARVDKLRELWAAGYSASEIAGLLGVSRNAVLGKRRRLDLPQRRDARPNTRGPRSPRVFLSPEARALAAEQARLRRESLPLIPRELPTPPPSTEFRCDVWALTSTTCRYPYGDGPFTFCGAPVVNGFPYCQHHREICFSPARVRNNSTFVSRSWR